MRKEALRDHIFLKRGRIREKVLENLKEPKTATELAKQLSKHRSSISRVLLDLEKKGFVTCINPEDSSFRHYQLTKKGKDLISENSK